MEMTEEQLREKLEQAKAEAVSELQKNVIDGTTWTSLEEMAKSARNADKKISEVTSERRRIEEELAAAKTKLEEAMQKKTGDQAPPPPATEQPEQILKTITDEEAKLLDEMIEGDETLKASVLEGGEKAMAEALSKIRKLAPKETAKNIFSAYKQNVTKGPSGTLQDALEKAFNNRMKRTPANRRPGTPPSVDEDEAPPVRAGGGMLEFAAPKEKVVS